MNSYKANLAKMFEECRKLEEEIANNFIGFNHHISNFLNPGWDFPV